jgi:hypothetical protein
VSQSAVAYVKSLRTTPNGAQITATEKLVLLLLADYFNHSLGFAYPSVATIAADASRSERRVREITRSLEKKGVLQVQLRKNGTNNDTNAYRFPGLVDQSTAAKSRSRSPAKSSTNLLRAVAAKPSTNQGLTPTSPGELAAQPTTKTTNQRRPSASGKMLRLIQQAKETKA